VNLAEVNKEGCNYVGSECRILHNEDIHEFGRSRRHKNKKIRKDRASSKNGSLKGS